MRDYFTWLTLVANIFFKNSKNQFKFWGCELSEQSKNMSQIATLVLSVQNLYS
jgi:hypothetical protein